MIDFMEVMKVIERDLGPGRAKNRAKSPRKPFYKWLREVDLRASNTQLLAWLEVGHRLHGGSFSARSIVDLEPLSWDNSNAVYWHRASDFSFTYIGSTKRRPTERIRRHIQSKTAFGTFLAGDGIDERIDFILGFTIPDVRFLESLMIFLFKPRLNVEESHYFSKIDGEY